MIRSLGDKKPKIAESALVSEGAYIVGDVEIGENCTVWPGAVIRGDLGSIRIGKNSHIEDNVVLHGAPSSLDIGDNVMIGHGAAVNARRIGNKVLIGMNATVLHEVEIGDVCVIAAGAVVTEGMQIPSGSFVTGVPAKIVGKVLQKHLFWVVDGPPFYFQLAQEYKKEGLMR